MKKKLAVLISRILSPYIVAVLTIVIVAYKASEQNIVQTAKWSGLIVSIFVGLPLLYIILKVKSGKLTDIHVRAREQRHKIYAIGAISLSSCIILMLYLNAPKMVIAMLVAAIIANAINFMINKFWKVSIHLTAMAGASIIFYILFGLPALIISLGLLILAAWSRIELKEHSFGQVIAGSIVAASTTFLVFKAFGL